MQVRVVGDADCYVVRTAAALQTLGLDLMLLVSPNFEHRGTVSSRHSCRQSVRGAIGFPDPQPTYYTHKTHLHSRNRDYSSKPYASLFLLQKSLPFQLVAIVEMNLIASFIKVLLRICYSHRRSKQSSEPLPTPHL